MSVSDSQLSDVSQLSIKERSNSIQLSLGNGSASILIPLSFSQDDINGLMELASKFELEDELDNDEDYFE